MVQEPLHVASSGAKRLQVRSEASWPLRYPVHLAFADHFPRLAETLVSAQPNADGFYIYHFGFCDFDSQRNADAAAAKLRQICDALSSASGRSDVPVMHALRDRLEEHLAYWNRGIVAPTDVRFSDQTAASNVKKSGRWSDDEHQLFLTLMKQYGRSWTQIAEKMPTRTEPQVRSHAQKYLLKLAANEDTADDDERKRRASSAASGGTVSPKRSRHTAAIPEAAIADAGARYAGRSAFTPTASATTASLFALHTSPQIPAAFQHYYNLGATTAPMYAVPHQFAALPSQPVSSSSFVLPTVPVDGASAAALNLPSAAFDGASGGVRRDLVDPSCDPFVRRDFVVGPTTSPLPTEVPEDKPPAASPSTSAITSAAD